MGDHLSEMAILKTQNALDAAVDITPLKARMSFMFFLPFFVLAPLTGLLADWLPRRGLMVFADLTRMLLMFFFATLIGWTQAFGSWGPFLPLLAAGMFAAVFSPARSALLPTIIRPEQLVRANGMIAGLGIIGTTAATLAGGLLAKHYPAQVAFQLDALTFLASGVCLSFMKPPRTTRPEKTTPFADLAAGFRYAKCHHHVTELLIVAALVWFCGSLVDSVIPAVARDVYQGGYPMISGFRALLGLGFVIGAIIISGLGDALRSEIAITWGLMGIGLSITMFALSVFLPLLPGLLAVIGGVAVVGAGVFGVSVMASFNALLQRTTADRYRGRVFGVNDVVTTGALMSATGALGLGYTTRLDAYAGYILAAVAIITFVAGAITLKVRLERSGHPLALSMVLNLNEFVCRWWWRMERIGPCTVPLEGAVIVTANHRSAPDPLFICATAKYRLISFMVAAEYTNIPIARWFMKLGECIPVKREIHDTGATKQALRYLRAGKALGMFIEGGIVGPGEVSEPKDGVAMLALKTGAKVIPVHISGTKNSHSIGQGLRTRHRARVRYGEPVNLDEFRKPDLDRHDIREATRRICAAIWALSPDGEPMPSVSCPVNSAHPPSSGRLAHESL